MASSLSTPVAASECVFSLHEIATATYGVVHGGQSPEVRGVSTDSRSVVAGSLFVALVGETHDGHAHVEGALAQGAAAVLVARDRYEGPPGAPRVEVDDTLLALGRLASYHLERARGQRALPVIAVGGSAGKTTTKELLAGGARALFGTTLATLGNQNNQIGVPTTVLRLVDAHAAAILECGTNQPGEIARLGAIVQPDVALLLNVDLEHTEYLGTIEQVADEEGALLLSARKAAVGWAEDPLVLAQLARTAVTQRTFGEATGDVRVSARAATPDGRSRITLEVAESLRAPGAPASFEVELRLLGPAAAIDCAAAACALACAHGPLDAAAMQKLAEGFALVEPVPGRLRPIDVRGVLVLDDTYNANPRSMRAGLACATELHAARDGARLLLVLADMLELGPDEARLHDDIVRSARHARPEHLVLVGPRMRAAAAGEAWFEDSAGAAVHVAALVRPGDVVLVKGSRGLRMEKVVEALTHGVVGSAA